MDPFTIISGIQACWAAGEAFMKAYQSWKEADREIAEQCVAIECVWIKTKLQIDVMHDTLPPDSRHRKLVDDSARVLSAKLLDAVAAIDDVIKRKPGAHHITVRKPKYMWLKETIEKAVGDLEDWQRRFDPSWFLILRIVESNGGSVKPKLEDAASRVKELAGAPKEKNTFDLARGLLDATSRPEGDRGLFLPERKFDRRPIPYSTAVLARQPQYTSKWLIIDSVQCGEQPDRDELTGSVRLLASKLKRADPLTFGLLSCLGVMKVNGANPSFDFVLNTPNGKNSFRSLRGELLSGGMPSLSQRLSIAKELTRSISYMHTFDFVHKNIRPETILIFDDAGAKKKRTFLVGFEGFRAIHGATARRGDAELHRDLYRHPSRQGQAPVNRYGIKHDIYSLGVCLLEIGLWTSFVEYPSPQAPQLGPSYNVFLDWLKEQSLETPYNPLSYLGDFFEHRARTALPELAGDRYADIVVKCLTCLDVMDDGDTDVRLGDVEEAEADTDDPKIVAGVKFIRDILVCIDELVI